MNRTTYTYLNLNLGAAVQADGNASLHAAARTLLSGAINGVLVAIPSYTTLLVEHDPTQLSRAELQRLVRRALQNSSSEHQSAHTVEVPTVYDGPDLKGLADAAGLSPTEVIARHAGTAYHAYAVGFTPGFPFLGDVDPAIRVPRLTNPRATVPAGSVGIADAQTGIYPLASPGGWILIGRATVHVYDPPARSRT